MAAVIPWFFKLACPQAYLFTPRFFFVSDIRGGVFPVSYGKSFPDHPAVNVKVPNAAHSDRASIAVCVAWEATHDAAPDLIRQRKSGFFATTVCLAIPCAELSIFCSVDSEKPDTFRMDFNGVAIND
jgi:hypothetical protein